VAQCDMFWVNLISASSGRNNDEMSMDQHPLQPCLMVRGLPLLLFHPFPLSASSLRSGEELLKQMMIVLQP